MNFNEKKEVMLDYIQIIEDYMEVNFQMIERLLKLEDYLELEDFFNYYFADNAVTAILFFLNGIEKL